MRFALVLGSTATAEIEGISAAGADPTLRRHTPSADAELVSYGRTILAPVVPVSPSGCPTPAIVTRAVRELLNFELTCIDGGLAAPTAAPCVRIGSGQGGDVREAEPVSDAGARFEMARRIGRGLPDDELFVGESIPGGTTTAMGVLRALGEPYGVSSSLPENPLERKSDAVETGFDASDLTEGDCSGAPIRAIRTMGDPVLATVAGLTAGAAETGIDVTLAGGTQMIAAVALLRHGDFDGEIQIATTSFVDDDPSVDIDAAAAGLDVDVTVTDPGFDRADHDSMRAFATGEAKEGVGMGGVLALADRADVRMSTIRDRIETVYDRMVTGDGS